MRSHRCFALQGTLLLYLYLAKMSNLSAHATAFSTAAATAAAAATGSASSAESSASWALHLVASASGAALDAFTKSAPAVGVAWIVSSAIFTTYSTTRLLKYDGGTLDRAPATRKQMRTWPMGRGFLTRRRLQEVSPPRMAQLQRAPADVLRSLPRPTLLTLYRFGGSLLLGLLVPPWDISRRIEDTIRGARQFAWPALFLLVANWSNSIALNRIGISLTYTSKCGIPLITVLMTVLFLKGTAASLPNARALACLLPIAAGIAAASWNSPSFEAVGFAAAVVSTASQAAMILSSKQAIIKTGMSGPAAQRSMVAVGLLLAILVATLQPILEHIGTSSDDTKIKDSTSSSLVLPPAWLSLMAAASYHYEYLSSFLFVGLVNPVTVGACDAVRRLSIILTGRYFFGGPALTRVNIGGIALALAGATGYSIFSSLP